MSAIAVPTGPSRLLPFYSSVIGKKVVMAVTGFILCGFVLGHMIGNLQVYQGSEKLNHYAQLLRISMPLLWTVRAVLLLAVVLHITAAVQLWLLKREARPEAYVKKALIATSYAARTMVWSGPIIFFFLVYHVLHLTTGTALGAQYDPHDVYHNVIVGFRNPAVSIFYIIANILLAIHLYHGVWSMFQSMGVNHPKYTPILKNFAKLYGWVIGLGNCSIPLAVLAGVIGGSVR